MQVPLLQLQCGVNSYDWGKLGFDSAATKHAAPETSDHLDIDPKKPYAELWMGTHPKLPSKDVQTKRSLLDMVQDNQSLMTPEINKRYENKLPFLFKILSIRKALSIQAHPNKKLAEQLHAKDPKNYPDDNHKPEMTIAITPFDGLCGFRPLDQIAHFLDTIPSFREMVGNNAAAYFIHDTRGKGDSQDKEAIETNKSALRMAFSAMMSSEKECLASCTEQLIDSIKADPKKFADGGGPSPNSGEELAELVLRLNGQYPGDIGLFVLFFLNYVKLDVGEGMFLKADDIHAYLSGDIIECMASSDNVVRAGFTPKYQDIKTLTSMLTYNYAPPSEQKMAPVDYPYVTLNSTAYSSSSTATLYDPPIEEFSVVRTDLKAKDAKATFEAIQGPSILVCTRGHGTITVGPETKKFEEGAVFFVGASAECILASTAGDSGFETFKAFCELEGKENANGAH